MSQYPDVVICPICSFECKTNLVVHLRREHRLTKKEFLEKYPGFHLMTKGYQAKKQKAANIRSKNSYETSSIAAKEMQKRKVERSISFYNRNPSKCKTCSHVFDYHERHRKYCDSEFCQIQCKKQPRKGVTKEGKRDKWKL